MPGIRVTSLLPALLMLHCVINVGQCSSEKQKLTRSTESSPEGWLSLFGRIIMSIMDMLKNMYSDTTGSAGLDIGGHEKEGISGPEMETRTREKRGILTVRDGGLDNNSVVDEVTWKRVMIGHLDSFNKAGDGIEEAKLFFVMYRQRLDRYPGVLENHSYAFDPLKSSGMPGYILGKYFDWLDGACTGFEGIYRSGPVRSDASCPDRIYYGDRARDLYRSYHPTRTPELHHTFGIPYCTQHPCQYCTFMQFCECSDRMRCPDSGGPY